MAKVRPSRLRPLMFWHTHITRSPAQKPAYKDLRRNGQSAAITPEATYVLAYSHNALASPETCT
ncbi:Malolactic regulator [Lacticaseibacillus rhamnosus]|nr:Malolactic regulator [Lacticaseibacillus rhamnosus]OXT03919.1 Malolactic regulator [Lacticaseibacillus rhamnosus]PCL25314.1 Malolactic regulator [Lacticaseibacillus rhamnosus]